MSQEARDELLAVSAAPGLAPRFTPPALSASVRRPMGESVISVSSDNAYHLAQVGPVVVVRLDAPPTPPALAALAGEVAQARERAGLPLAYVAVVPPQAAGISAEMRPVMAEFGRYVSSVSETVHVVIEASGFAGTVMRSAVTAVLLASRARHVNVASRFAEVFTAIRPRLSQKQADELLATADVLGVAR